MKKLISFFLIVTMLITTSVFATGYKYRNIASAATTLVKSGRGKLVAIHVNKAVLSGVITIYDNTSAAGTKIATITNPATILQAQYSFEYNVEVALGITVVTSLGDDVTVIYE